jgi:hypothetical protein
MVVFAKWIVVFFGIFLIAVGFLMLIAPEKAREYLRKAASTNFINYGEITIRMIPAAAMVVYAAYSKFPEAFRLFGGFMIATSCVLYLVPRRVHRAYALKSADILKPTYMRLVSPYSILLGSLMIYAVM